MALNDNIPLNIPKDVVLVCGGCQQELNTLHQYHLHKCAHENNNQSSKINDHGYLERVHGPIATLIPARYHQFIDGQTLKSYVASNERDAQIFKQKVGPADIPVITKKNSNKVNSQISDNLTDSGKDAINDINSNLFNLLIDWCPNFESFVCSKPVPDPDHSDTSINMFGQESVDDHEASQEEQEQSLKSASGSDLDYVDGKWTKEATILLLEQYKSNMHKFNDPKIKKKNVWIKIPGALKQNGFEFDGTKCERKLINMKSKYKSTTIHNKTTGNSPKMCSFYEELDDIFGNSPAIIPVATCSNLQGITIEQKKTSCTTSDTAAEPTTSKTGKHHIEEKNEVYHAEAVGSVGKSKTKCLSKKLKTEERVLNAITDLSKELQEKEEERMRIIREMHTEQMAATHRFIDCFEQFLNQKKS